MGREAGTQHVPDSNSRAMGMTHETQTPGGDPDERRGQREEAGTKIRGGDKDQTQTRGGDTESRRGQRPGTDKRRGQRREAGTKAWGRDKDRVTLSEPGVAPATHHKHDSWE